MIGQKLVLKSLSLKDCLAASGNFGFSQSIDEQLIFKKSVNIDIKGNKVN